MSRRLARGALRLYPLAYRRRYGAEIEALLEDSPGGALTVLDLLRGAVIAHARPAATRHRGARPRMSACRASSSAILACWIAFAAAGIGFYKTTEGPAFSHAGDAHLALSGSHFAIQALADPRLDRDPRRRAAARHRRRPPASHARVPRSVPPASPPPRWPCSGSRPRRWSRSRTRCPRSPGGTAAAVLAAWSAIALACGAACAIAARRGLFAIDVGRRGLIAALSLGTVVTVSMASIAVATALYLIALAIDSGALAGEANGPLGLITVAASVVAQLAIMVASAGLAMVTTVRGWRALRAA